MYQLVANMRVRLKERVDAEVIAYGHLGYHPQGLDDIKALCIPHRLPSYNLLHAIAVTEAVIAAGTLHFSALEFLSCSAGMATCTSTSLCQLLINRLSI